MTARLALRSPVDIPQDSKLYTMLWFGGWAIIVALLLVSWAAWDITLFDQYGITFNGGSTSLLVAICFLALGAREVEADYIAGAFFYGKALKEMSSGFHWIWPVLMQLLKAPRDVQEFQCPDEPENVFKGDDKEPLPPGMVRAIRAVTRAPLPTEKDMLDVRMTLDINFVIQYVIEHIFAFKSNFGGSIANVQRQMRDVGERTIAEEITRNTPASFIAKLPDTNDHLAAKVEERFLNSGVRIISAYLISPDISHKVSGALADIPVARAKAVQTEINAGAEEIKRTKEGAGTANAELALLTARAKGEKEIKNALGITDGNAVLASEAVRNILEKTDVLVMGGEGMRDAMGLVKAAQSALNSGKGVTP